MSVHSVFIPSTLCGTTLPLSRTLARSGFVFENQADGLYVGGESPSNRAFLNKLLTGAHLESLCGDLLVYPADYLIDQAQWLTAWQRLVGGSEGGPSGLIKMELAGLDAYIAGIARWLTALGIITQGSCDGHGKSLPRLHLMDHTQASAASVLIERESKRRISYNHYVICGGVWQSKDRFYIDLLDLAEALHETYSNSRGAQLAPNM